MHRQYQLRAEKPSQPLRRFKSVPLERDLVTRYRVYSMMRFLTADEPTIAKSVRQWHTPPCTVVCHLERAFVSRLEIEIDEASETRIRSDRRGSRKQSSPHRIDGRVIPTQDRNSVLQLLAGKCERVNPTLTTVQTRGRYRRLATGQANNTCDSPVSSGFSQVYTDSARHTHATLTTYLR